MNILVDSSPEHVVLLHGLFHRGLAVSLLARRLRQAGFSTSIFSYPSRQKSLSTLAQDLYRFTEALEHNVESLHFMGHSLGGLVILAMLEEYSQDLPQGRSVLLGSPVQGSKIARQLSEKSAGRLVLGRARQGLTTACQYSRGYEVGVIAGIGSTGVSRLLGQLPEPNDGTVTVAETNLPEANDSIEVASSHFGLLLNSEVSRQSAYFLRHGQFQRADDQFRLK
ncbi:MAG: alpha/beta hydrolase [Xanthomonadales bacterium]|nr:alpha/beta hydrolase [Xanthomonadales bacterium]